MITRFVQSHLIWTAPQRIFSQRVLWIPPENIWLTHDRSTRSQMLFKIGGLKNFVIFTGNHLCWSLFLIKLFKKRIQHSCFPVNFRKLLRTALIHRAPKWKKQSCHGDRVCAMTIIINMSRLVSFGSELNVVNATAESYRLYILPGVYFPRCHLLKFTSCFKSRIETFEQWANYI